MKDSVDIGAAWAPSREDEMLLGVAFAPEGQARDAALTWLETVNLATQGAATNRLLPLVYDRLLRESIDHPVMAILKGVRRQVWCRNQLLFRRATPAIRALRLAGIDVMLLKGAALTLNYYHDYGLRPMGDFDLMVPLKNVASVIKIFSENGWKSDLPMQGKLGRNILTYSHAEHFKDNSGYDLDLHWHLSPLCTDPASDFAFWNGSIAARFESVDVCVLNAADELLHVCVHGLMWSETPGIRWIPDSLTIIEKAAGLDWNRLLLQARERNLTVFVRSALNYLFDQYGASVTRDVLQALNALPVTSNEVIEYSANARLQSSIVNSLRAHSCNYRRSTTGAKLHGYNVSLAGYIGAIYRRETGWRLFFEILYRIGRRAWRSMRGVVSR